MDPLIKSLGVASVFTLLIMPISLLQNRWERKSLEKFCDERPGSEEFRQMGRRILGWMPYFACLISFVMSFLLELYFNA